MIVNMVLLSLMQGLIWEVFVIVEQSQNRADELGDLEGLGDPCDHDDSKESQSSSGSDDGSQ